MAIDPAQATERGPTRTQWAISSLAGMGALLDGYDLSVIGFGVVLAAGTFGFSAKADPLLYSMVLTSALVGMAVGSLLFGWLADRIGRKTAFSADLLFFVVFALLSAFSQNVYELITFRLLMGIGIGGDYPVSSTLISEFAPRNSRGRLLMYGIMFYWVGTLAAGVVNYFALGMGASIAWRAALAAGGIIAIPVVVARNVAPESPRWLMSKNRSVEAEAISNRVSGTKELAPAAGSYDFSELFRKYRRQILFVTLTWFSFDVGAYGLGFYSATLYSLYGIKSLAEIALFGAISAPFPILAYLVLMKYVDVWGRRIPSIAGFAVMTGVLATLPTLLRINAIFLLPLFILYSSLEQWPGGIFSFGYSVELFPTTLRARAQGIGTAVSRIGAIIGTLFFLPIAAHGLVYGTLFFEAFIILALLLTLAFAPEIKRNELEEVAGELPASPDSS